MDQGWVLVLINLAEEKELVVEWWSFVGFDDLNHAGPTDLGNTNTDMMSIVVALEEIIMI